MTIAENTMLLLQRLALGCVAPAVALSLLPLSFAGAMGGAAALLGLRHDLADARHAVGDAAEADELVFGVAGDQAGERR
ncbi:MAG TPA: hypothetical protein VIP30_13730, partial [Stenotrophomonas sp.]